MDEELLTRIRKEAYEQGYQDGMVEGYNLAGAKLIKRKKGIWIDTGSGEECSICREIQYGYDNFRHYCPNCGAIMGERRDDAEVH